MLPERSRRPELDVLRGIGITLIVLSHSTVPDQPLRLLLFSFHVPLFFALSGYLYTYNPKKLYRRICVWLSAYAALSIVDMICLWLFLPQAFTASTIIRGWLNLDDQLIFNSPKWFLLTLSEVELLYGLMADRPRRFKLSLCAACVVIAYFVRSFWPFGLHTIFVSLAFFTAGDLLKPFPLPAGKSWRWTLAAVLVAIFCVVSSVHNGHASIQALQYGRNYLLYWINAFCGIFVCYMLAARIGHCRLLEYLGKNSIYILCLHYYFMRGLFPRLFPHIYSTFWGQAACTAAAIGIISCFVLIWNRIKTRLMGRGTSLE